MKSTSKKSVVLIIASLIILITLSAMWAINKYQNEKMYREEYAIIFDESLAASYPLLVNTANALYVKADLFENNAYEANKYATNHDAYIDMVTRLNGHFWNTSEGHKVYYWFIQYDWFISSLHFVRLLNGSELRKKETRAVREIEFSRQFLNNWEKYEPDTLIRECKDIKVALNKAIRDLDDYMLPSQDVNAWRNIDPSDCYELQERYNARKNWPFTFLNKK